MSTANTTLQKKVTTFDEMLETNIPEFTGLFPVTQGTWHSLLTDLANAMYTWQSPVLGLDELMLIEQYFTCKQLFGLVQLKYKKGNAIITSPNYRVMKFVPMKRGPRNVILTARVICENPPKDLILDYSRDPVDYRKDEFLLFDDNSLTHPINLIAKYSECLAKLDSLYDQNIDKLGVPIIALCNKSMKNDLLNLFKRTKLNALFALMNNERNKTAELFYDAKIEFILDKVNEQRIAIMKEFMQELGVNPNDEVGQSTHYVNTVAIKESSLISKFFGASRNKLRDNFMNKANSWRPELQLSYYTTVKTYTEELTNDETSEEGIE